MQINVSLIEPYCYIDSVLSRHSVRIKTRTTRYKVILYYLFLISYRLIEKFNFPIFWFLPQDVGAGSLTNRWRCCLWSVNGHVWSRLLWIRWVSHLHLKGFVTQHSQQGLKWIQVNHRYLQQKLLRYKENNAKKNTYFYDLKNTP